ncbi:MAG: UxaA family hydrolase, partial [Desulfobacteraceae bacterium]
MAKIKPMTICLNAQDNVAVALINLTPGAAIGPDGIICKASVPAGHKVAIRKIKAHDAVRKYGQIIGFASKDIQPGDHVHTHNMGMGDFIRDYSIGADARLTEIISKAEQATFNGIIRKDGRVATRNYIGVLSTVNCSASVARFIAESF